MIRLYRGERGGTKSPSKKRKPYTPRSRNPDLVEKGGLLFLYQEGSRGYRCARIRGKSNLAAARPSTRLRVEASSSSKEKRKEADTSREGGGGGPSSGAYRSSFLAGGGPERTNVVAEGGVFTRGEGLLVLLLGGTIFRRGRRTTPESLPKIAERYSREKTSTPRERITERFSLAGKKKRHITLGGKRKEARPL